MTGTTPAGVSAQKLVGLYTEAKKRILDSDTAVHASENPDIALLGPNQTIPADDLQIFKPYGGSGHAAITSGTITPGFTRISIGEDQQHDVMVPIGPTPGGNSTVATTFKSHFDIVFQDVPAAGPGNPHRLLTWIDQAASFSQGDRFHDVPKVPAQSYVINMDKTEFE